MAKRKRLEPFSAEELTDLLDNNPSKQGLERILRFDLDKVTTRSDPFPGATPFPAPADPVKLKHLSKQPMGESPLNQTPIGDNPMGELPISQQPAGDSPVGDRPSAEGSWNRSGLTGSSERPTGGSLQGDSPLGQLPTGRSLSSDASGAHSPVGEIPMGQQPMDTPAKLSPARLPVPLLPMSDSPMGHLPVGQPPPLASPYAIPYMEVEGRGKRPLRFCRTVQDGHTSSEQIAYQAIWTFARRSGRPDADGSQLVDLSVSQLCALLGTDHKQVKRLVHALEEKLAIEVVRQPDFRLAHPTRYRIYNYTKILERRRSAGLVWVVRTRAVRFVDPATVEALLLDSPMGQSPVGDLSQDSDPPTGQSPEIPIGQPPESPMGQSPGHISNRVSESIGGTEPSTAPPLITGAIIREFGFVDDDALQTLVRKCRDSAPDATDEEIAELAAMQARRIRQMRGVDNPVGLLITQVARCFKGEPLALYRRERAEQQRRLQELLGGEDPKP
jgi:hypothetical protein